MIFWMSCVELDSNPSCWMGRGIKGKTIIKVLVFGVGIHVKIRLAIGFFVVFQYDQKQVVSSVSFSRLSWAWCSLSSCGFESACGSPDSHICVHRIARRMFCPCFQSTARQPSAYPTENIHRGAFKPNRRCDAIATLKARRAAR